MPLYSRGVPGCPGCVPLSEALKSSLPSFLPFLPLLEEKDPVKTEALAEILLAAQFLPWAKCVRFPQVEMSPDVKNSIIWKVFYLAFSSYENLMFTSDLLLCHFYVCLLLLSAILFFFSLAHDSNWCQARCSWIFFESCSTGARSPQPPWASPCCYPAWECFFSSEAQVQPHQTLWVSGCSHRCLADFDQGEKGVRKSLQINSLPCLSASSSPFFFLQRWFPNTVVRMASVETPISRNQASSCDLWFSHGHLGNIPFCIPFLPPWPHCPVLSLSGFPEILPSHKYWHTHFSHAFGF